MKKLMLFISISFIWACQGKIENKVNSKGDVTLEKEKISSMLDSFNMAAANADFNKYFQFYTDDAIFIGTDATENWNKEAFMKWAKPAFDKKRTWNFKSMKRNIYFGSNPDMAWFDELLNTGMKICRGSGVVINQNNEWKVQQYVLSMTIPNEKIDEVLKIKGPIEDSLMKTIR
jgi:hypothetical protein